MKYLVDSKRKIRTVIVLVFGFIALAGSMSCSSSVFETPNAKVHEYAYKGLQEPTKTNQSPPHAGVSVWETIAVFLGGILALAVFWRVLFLVYRRMCRSCPAFNALVKGEAPWNQPARKPARLALVTFFALAVALAVIASLVGAGILVGYIGNHW